MFYNVNSILSSLLLDPGLSSVAVMETTLRRNGQMTGCPVCGANLSIEDETVVSELVDCAECASELEVVSLDPPKLAEAPEAAEDWGE